jgi:hypothetical protein
LYTFLFLQLSFHACSPHFTSSTQLQLHVKRALLFFKRKEKIFFDLTLFLGLLRRVSPEQGSPAVAKLVPQHPFDAFGRSNCM